MVIGRAREEKAVKEEGKDNILDHGSASLNGTFTPQPFSFSDLGETQLGRESLTFCHLSIRLALPSFRLLI
jgi:hypothetical protein